MGRSMFQPVFRQYVRVHQDFPNPAEPIVIEFAVFQPAFVKYGTADIPLREYLAIILLTVERYLHAKVLYMLYSLLV